MKQWSSLGMVVALVGVGLASPYGCGLTGENCVELANCAPIGGNAGGAGEQGAGGVDVEGADGGGGSGGAPVEQNCQNGTDDDGDGKEDCIDSDCAGKVECVPAPPLDAYGYYLIRIGKDEALPMACALGGVPEKLYADPEGDAEKIKMNGWCTPCSCDTQDVSCTNPSLKCFDKFQACGGDQVTIDLLADCADRAKLPGAQSCQADGPSEASGAPVPGGGMVFDIKQQLRRIYACPVEGVSMGPAGCAPDHACVSRQALSPNEQLCVKMADDSAACPSAWPGLVKAYMNYDDKRGCEECKCSIPECKGGYEFYPESNCMGDPTDVSVCVKVESITSKDVWSLKQVPYTAVSTPSGGKPHGQLVPTGAVDFCCRP